MTVEAPLKLARIKKLNTHFVWVKSVEDSIKFYRDVMGFSISYQEPRYVTMRAGDLTLSFQAADRAELLTDKTSHLMLNVEVDSVWDFYRQLSDRSVIVSEPRSAAWDCPVLVCEFTDMNGIHWALTEPMGRQ